MPLHSVRFDEETEEALNRVCEAMGASRSDVLKKGVMALARKLAANATSRPFDIYRTIDLGSGGYARAPARKAKQAIRTVIRAKHER
jgi:hypothetical protein